MAGVNSKFSLFALPSNAHKNVLRTMLSQDLIKYSLCSKCNKDRVQTLGMRLFKLQSEIYFHIKLELFFTAENKFSVYFFPFNDINSDFVCITSLDTENARDIELGNYQMSVREWIEHFMDIFSYPKFDDIAFQDNFIDIEILADAFKNFKCDDLIYEPPDMGYFSRLIQKVFPQLEYYQIMTLDNTHFESKHKVLMQNANTVYVSSDQLHTIGLNELLVLNIKHFHQLDSTLSNKELNRILKMWVAGFYPRFVALNLNFKRKIDKDEILEKLSFRIMGPNERRQFAFPKEPPIQIANDILIKRKDGTEAALLIHSQGTFSILALLVFM
ncbi:hypothetical protein CAEBREN_13004 [Caenorhabditis brenneri]|uniref:Sdz-33 F-box domain-containing protein n=1 Tax=Caenorhabditis brenneri TaxID=135651 RepID=G0NZJ1_CAEBE|nr:hypothetical protein CAEBREN_13004 [Caenorhabditis brenneri]